MPGRENPPTRLLLAGAGYAHLLLLRQLASRPLRDAAVTLVSPVEQVPYSGMLPGALSGEYRVEDIHIDLHDLCRRAGVELVVDVACGIDTTTRELHCRSGDSRPWGLLSLNTGPMPDTGIPGSEHAIPVKPVAGLLAQWQVVRHALSEADESRHLVMVGGGPGSVETLIGMVLALDRQSGSRHCRHRFTLITQSPRLLPGYPRRVSELAAARCRSLGITLITDCRLTRIEAGTAHTSQQRVAFHHLFLCTRARAPEWLAASGLDCDEAGFLRVDAGLRSLSSPGIFAAGDVASFSPPLPKAGVYAVRQAPVLARNIERALCGQSPLSYRPQRRYLSLLSLGDGMAVGRYGGLALHGRWVARWKHRIDQRFMDAMNPEK